MRIDLISVQPQMFGRFLETSIVGRAVAKGLCEIGVIDLRDYGIGRWRKVDDKPYGGGPGMLMRCEPWYAAVEAAVARGPGSPRIVLTTPAGRRFGQRDAESLAAAEHLIFMCGHYEGFDARVEELATDAFSVGDFVMTGGEIAAAAMTDAVVRLLPGALGGGQAAVSGESFGRAGGLEAPQYTRPEEFRGRRVPAALLSGDHVRIERWRAAAARERTARLRPDLLAEGGVAQ